jgi:hypothetical protein
MLPINIYNDNILAFPSSHFLSFLPAEYLNFNSDMGDLKAKRAIPGWNGCLLKRSGNGVKAVRPW